MLPSGNSAVVTEGSDALRSGSGYGESMNETSPGGSTIRRYARWMMPKIGVPDEPIEDYAKWREAVYSELFGEADKLRFKATAIPSLATFCELRGGFGDFLRVKGSPYELGLAQKPKAMGEQIRDILLSHLLY